METDNLEGNGSDEPGEYVEESMDCDQNDGNEDIPSGEYASKISINTHEEEQQECVSPMEMGNESPAAESSDGEISSDGAIDSIPTSPKIHSDAAVKKVVHNFSDDEDIYLLDLNSPIGLKRSQIVEGGLSSLQNTKTIVERSVDSNVKPELGNKRELCEVMKPDSGKSTNIAQSSNLSDVKSDLGSGEILSDVGSDDDDGSLKLDNSLPRSPKITPKSYSEMKAAPRATHTLSVHDRLDFSLRVPHDDHGELDYEEDVEYGLDTSKKDDSHLEEKEEGEESEKEEGEHLSDDTDGELDDDDDCEEGEIKDAPRLPDVVEEGQDSDSSDLDDEEPFNNQPPVCHFFLRSSCTWGLECRYYHPGMHNGTYNEGMKAWDGNEIENPDEPEDVMPVAPPASPPAESAWERGLRQAKELRKKSQKRKENEPDFEEKRKNLSLNVSDAVEEEPKSIKENHDHNKENERDKIQYDPYYDNINSPPTRFEDEDFNYNSKPVEGWHGGGNYENFEVKYTREPPRHFTEPYPDFRLPERERAVKEKYTANYHLTQEQSHGHDRYEKHKVPEENANVFKKYLSYVDTPDKLKKQQDVRPQEVSRARGGETWIDPWQRAKSPIRRKNSSSRSRSRGRRRSRSGSSSYSSGSYSSRSRSSSYTSRSSYSRSSSYSSRSSSRSPSPPLHRKGLPLVDPAKKLLIASKSSDMPPRSFVTKAGPMVPNVTTKKDAASSERRPGVMGPDRRTTAGPNHRNTAPTGADRRTTSQKGAQRRITAPTPQDPPPKVPEGPPKPPAMQRAPATQRPAAKTVIAKALANPVVVKPVTKSLAKAAPAKSASSKLATSKPVTSKPTPPKPVTPKPVTPISVAPKSAAPKPAAPKPVIPSKPVVKAAVEINKFRLDSSRPGRSLRPRAKSVSSISSSSRSRSRSYSSSGSSRSSRSRSRSRSRLRSSSGSSSSSHSSSGSDDLYGDMASPTRSKGSRSPQSPRHARSRSYRGHPKNSSRGHRKERDPTKYGHERLRPDTYSRKIEEKPLPVPVVSQAKDPLKLQGQKSSIKLTLKSSKTVDASTSKKRRIESNSVEAPPVKKTAVTPVKEAKEPVRMSLAKSDKHIKPPVKEVTISRSTASTDTAKSPSKVPVPAKPAAAAPEPVQKKKSSASSRREELLKQLKAVEDAIARKRTK